MKKLKLDLRQFEGAEVLTRGQLKRVLGGGGDGGAGSGGGTEGCCAHVEGWSGGYQCGYSSSAEAEAAASAAAIEYGVRTFYCCSCANSPGYPG